MARRLMIAAETIDGDQALHCGLADRAGDLQVALDWAHEIARLAPLSLAHNKRVLTAMIDTTHDAAIAESFAACWASDDVREGAVARAEGRPPNFMGR